MKKILLVEDNETIVMGLIYSLEDDKDIAKIINKTLSKQGYEVVSIYDGRSFYEKLGLTYSDTFDFKVLKRSSTNRIISLSINGNEYSGRSLYNKLGLRSTDFSLKKDGDKIIISTIGYGHGVGMRQYGALGMAEDGYNYEEILSYYYSGTKIKKMEN